MKHWPAEGAEARFDELLEASLKDGPQVITERGVPTAVLVPFEEWQRLNPVPQRSLKDLLLADEPRFDLDIPERGKGRRRDPIDFDD